MFKYIVTGIGIFSAIFAFLVFSGKLPIGKGSEEKKAVGSLTMWGTLPREDVSVVLNQMNIDEKTYSISYEEIPEQKFQEVLVAALADGTGPDMILADYKVILAQRQRLLPFPFTSFPVNDFKNSYVDGASIFLVSDGILAFPVTIEPMMMFVNRDTLSKNTIATAPEYWDEILGMAPQITGRDQSGKLVSYGVGLGTFSNIVHAKEIIMGLVRLLGQEPVIVDANGTPSFIGNNPLTQDSVVLPFREGIKLFTQFSDPSKESYSWNSFTGSSDKEAFTAGKLALYFGFSGEAKEIAQKNERLNFYMSPFPLARGYPNKANSMKMYGVAVLKRTKSELVLTAYTAQSTLANSKYSTSVANNTGKLSPIRSVISANQDLDSGLKSSILVTRGWYDVKEDVSTDLLKIAVDDIVSGKKTPSRSAEDFESSLNDIYAR
jgi:ABC-type glycerol-3-phosphate transport system substrate-binding protein